MANTVITGPEVEPLSTAEAKAHLVVEHDDDNALIDSYVTAARRACEQLQWRSYITQTREEQLDRFPPSHIDLPYGPVQSITSIKYIDSDGVEQTLSAANYDLDSVNSRATLGYNLTWPVTRDVSNAVKVRYVAGYGDAGSDVPEDIRSAIRLLVGHLYANRESVITGTISSVLPQTVEFLLGSEDARSY